MVLQFPHFSALLLNEIIVIATFDLLNTFTFGTINEAYIFNNWFKAPKESWMTHGNDG